MCFIHYSYYCKGFFRNLSNTLQGVCDNKLTQTKTPERAEQKIAETFNTNRTDINEATNMPVMNSSRLFLLTEYFIKPKKTTHNKKGRASLRYICENSLYKRL